MSEWWYVIVIVVVAVLAVLFFRDRQQRRDADANRPVDADSTRDYRAEREDTRVTGMSAEDREWEAASLRRNQENRDRAAQQEAEPRPAAGADVSDREPRA